MTDTGTDTDDDPTMLAIVHDPAAHSLSLQSLPVPVPLGPDEHLIQVHAVALTNGELTWPEPAVLRPAIPGYEVAGTVVQAPSPASPFQPGTEVYARTNFDRQGHAREYSIARTSELGQKPENLSWEEAATVPLSALTAWQALFVHAGLTPPTIPPRKTETLSTRSTWSKEPTATAAAAVADTATKSTSPPTDRRPSSPAPPRRSPSTSRPGSRRRRSFIVSGSADDGNANKRVLITAAAGGVGLWAVQLARLAGVGHITATCGPANVDFVRSLGANRVLDYTTFPTGTTGTPTSPYADKFDLVLDCVGGETLRAAWTSARHGGMVISVAMPADRMKPPAGAGGVGMDVKSVYFIVEADHAQLQTITQLIEAKAAKAAFDSAFPLEQYEAAFAKVHSGHVRGKVVLRVA